jgi:hypothetical protein
MMFDDFDLTSIFGGPMGMSLFGGPGGGSLFNKLPELPVSGQPAAPDLLKAGGDDMQPPGLPSPGAGLVRAVEPTGPAASYMPTSLSRTLASARDPGVTGSVNMVNQAAAPPAAAPAPVGGGPAPIQPGPGVLRPALDPDRNKPFPNVKLPTIPNSGGGPDERGPSQPVPIVPPRIDTSLPAAGGRPVAGPEVAAPAAPAAQPGAGTTQEEPNQSPLQKFLSEMGNVKPGAQQPLHPANMSYGAPHVPQGGADILAKIMAEHAGLIPKIGPVPSFEMQRQRRR